MEFRRLYVSREKKQVQKLSTSCIYTICNHFKRFLYARNSCDHYPPKYFRFLQKEYSSFLFKQLLQREEVFYESLDFLINPYLRSVNLNVNHVDQILPVAQGIKTISREIVHLKLSGLLSRLQLLVKSLSFCYFLNLQSLSLKYATKVELAAIGKCCTILQYLDLSYCIDVDDDSIQAFLPTNANLDICQNFSLQYLDISCTAVTETSLPIILDHFPNLRVLHHEKLFSTLAFLYKNDYLVSSTKKTLNLTELKNFHDPYGPSPQTLHISSLLCPRITKLKLGRVKSSESLISCCTFAKLEDISFEFTPDELDSFLHFLKCKGENLRKMEIIYRDFRFMVSSLCSLCPNLTFISINKFKFDLPEEADLLNLYMKASLETGMDPLMDL